MIRLYLNTLRFLKPVQIFGRVWFYIYKPVVGPCLASMRPGFRKPIPFVHRRQSMLTPSRFKFLNKEGELRSPSDWNSREFEKLWLYNLHYFDDLHADGFENRKVWHKALIKRWIKENEPFKGNGWEPYTVSRRIVNWVFWALSGNELSDEALESLKLQAAWLSRRLEWHILGNHLLANAKASIFAGLFLEGEDPDKWLKKGSRIFSEQLLEQVLEDGGHFELSPMYHALVLEDVLDVVNILSSYPDVEFQGRSSLISQCSEISTRMLSWLEVMTHPDGDIALFNDSAFEISATAGELAKYAERFGINSKNIMTQTTGVRITHLDNTGYVRVNCGEATAFLDVAKIGPDYLTGHSHADTLNFELSIGNQRVIVDSGASLYETGEERQRQRGTKAHNTVVVDDADSSEVWGSFRTARRAFPMNLSVDEKKGSVHCSHNGYKRMPGRPVHERVWIFAKNSLEINDTIKGKFEKAVSFLHFHPEVKLDIPYAGGGYIVLSDGRQVKFSAKGGDISLKETAYHPEFGVSTPNRCIEVSFNSRMASFRIEW